MSALGIDPTTAKTMLAVLGLVAVPVVAGVFSVMVSRRNAVAQIEAARIAAASVAEAKADAKAEEVKSEARRLAEERARRMQSEVDGLIGGLNTLVANQGTQIERLWREVQSNQEAIAKQRHDMTAIADEKAKLERKVYLQEDNIADLQTADLLKTNLLNRLQTKLSSAFDYIQTLTQQLIDHGHEPHPIPPDLRDRK